MPQTSQVLPSMHWTATATSANTRHACEADQTLGIMALCNDVLLAHFLFSRAIINRDQLESVVQQRESLDYQLIDDSALLIIPALNQLQFILWRVLRDTTSNRSQFFFGRPVAYWRHRVHHAQLDLLRAACTLGTFRPEELRRLLQAPISDDYAKRLEGLLRDMGGPGWHVD